MVPASGVGDAGGSCGRTDPACGARARPGRGDRHPHAVDAPETTQISDEAIGRGTPQKTPVSALEALSPEAAWFGVEDVCRTACVFFDLAGPSRMPRSSEPFSWNSAPRYLLTDHEPGNRGEGLALMSGTGVGRPGRSGRPGTGRWGVVCPEPDLNRHAPRGSEV